LIICGCFLQISLKSDAQFAPNKMEESAMASDRRILDRQDTLYLFFAITPAMTRRTGQDKLYYWFRQDTILATRGGYGGRLLDGEYKVLYPNKNLRELGHFSYGLKVGEWKTWFPNGELKSITHWKNGEETQTTKIHPGNNEKN
jgi:hypothetical protein